MEKISEVEKRIIATQKVSELPSLEELEKQKETLGKLIAKFIFYLILLILWIIFGIKILLT
ncbi:MAG: hypothetical protein B6D55_05060 [Candidatus Omnitrophica bacterium 4484_70.2]|nr:MAG: hypothetical protein B6D55_05060 [Candidatus Omnitrophica bacterium 4484_70.2]